MVGIMTDIMKEGGAEAEAGEAAGEEVLTVGGEREDAVGPSAHSQETTRRTHMPCQLECHRT